jgi:hypothetical protein
MMPPVPYDVPDGAIGLELSFGFLAGGDVTSTSAFMRKYNALIEIDGMRHERARGAWHVFLVAAA